MKTIAGIFLNLWLASLAAFAYTSDSATSTITTDGSSTDVQNAINAASDGWTVVIPAGSYTWSSGVAIAGKGIHLKGSGTVSISGTAAPKIRVAKDNTHVVEVSGLRLSGGNQKMLIVGAWSAKPFVVRDCAFSEENSQSLRIECNGGLVYRCQFVGVKGYNDQAIQHKNDSDPDGSWSTADTLGTRDVNGDKNLYVEDCTFTNMIYQAFDFDGISRIVIRYCTFSDSATTSHGADTGPIGMRHVEMYGNRFVFNNYGDCDGSRTTPLDYFVFIRGGTGCIFSNSFDRLQSCAWGSKGEIKLQIQNIRRGPTQIACQTTYPAYRQIGVGHNGTSYTRDPLYIWGHSTMNVANAQYEPDQCGNGQLQSTYLVAGRDYYTSTPRPGYTPYTYPHPLHGTSASKPAPPQNLRISGSN